MRKFPATLILVFLNVLVFILMAIVQEDIMFNRPQDFIVILFTGANFNPFTVGGEYWRLFSSIFMHWGIIHLAVNMYALYVIGRELEPFMGTQRFALLYFVTGIAAGLSSLLFNLYTVSAGASGAIFGLYGYMIVWQVLGNFRNKRLFSSVLVNFLILIAISYVIGSHANVDTPAHIGGFVTGALLSLINYFGLLIPVFQWAILATVMPSLVFAVPRVQLQYYNVFQRVVNAEDHLQRVYNQMLTDDQRGDSLNYIIPQWDSASLQLKQLSDVPAGLINDTTILSQYISFRREEVNYRLLGVARESFVYLDSIELVNEKVRALPPLKYILNYKPTAVIQSMDTSASVLPGEVITVFYDSSWREITNQREAHFYRMGIRDSLGRWQGDVRDYYINGNVQMKGRYLNDMHDGVFRYYTRDGKYESLGRYDKERAVGKWENFYKNGQLQSEIYYGDQFYTKSVWDSLGNQQVAGGDGKEITWHKNGTVAEEGEYRDGLKEGNWRGYFATGKPHYQEFYRNGRLVRGVAMDEQGQRYIYDQLSVFPFPVMGMNAYKDYLDENLKRPKEAERLNGIVKITFSVDTDGSLRDFIVTEGLCVPCDKEAIRLIKEGPSWRPGVLRGHVKILSRGYVEVYY